MKLGKRFNKISNMAAKRLRNKCAIVCNLSPRPFGERVRERGYLAAFTLAEVLITLGIIGVVAAMTIPTLMANHRKKVAETKLEKIYSVMNQAINLTNAEYGDVTNWIIDCGSSNSPTCSINEVENWFNSTIGKHIETLKTGKIKNKSKEYH